MPQRAWQRRLITLPARHARQELSSHIAGPHQAQPSRLILLDASTFLIAAVPYRILLVAMTTMLITAALYLRAPRSLPRPLLTTRLSGANGTQDES